MPYSSESASAAQRTHRALAHRAVEAVQVLEPVTRVPRVGVVRNPAVGGAVFCEALQCAFQALDACGHFVREALGAGGKRAAQLFDQSVRGTQDVKEILGVLPLTAVPVIENSGSAALRRKFAFHFAMRTVVGVALAYFVVARFVL